MQLIRANILLAALFLAGCTQKSDWQSSMSKPAYTVRMMLASSSREGAEERKAELIEFLWDPDAETRREAIRNVAWVYKNEPLPVRARERLLALESDLAVAWEARRVVKELGLRNSLGS